MVGQGWGDGPGTVPEGYAKVPAIIMWPCGNSPSVPLHVLRLLPRSTTHTASTWRTPGTSPHWPLCPLAELASYQPSHPTFHACQGVACCSEVLWGTQEVALVWPALEPVSISEGQSLLPGRNWLGSHKDCVSPGSVYLSLQLVRLNPACVAHPASPAKGSTDNASDLSSHQRDQDFRSGPRALLLQPCRVLAGWILRSSSPSFSLPQELHWAELCTGRDEGSAGADATALHHTAR